MSIRALVLLLALFVQQLPAPFHTPWFRKATRVVLMPDGHQLTVPAGFTVNLFADKLQYARFMALAPNGDVFLAEPFRGAGRITVLRDAIRMDTGILDVAAYSREEMKLDIHELMDPTLRKPLGDCDCGLKFPHECRLHGGQMKGDWKEIYGRLPENGP